MNPVALRNIELRYGDSTILQDISLTVSSGELLIIIGPNGAGKTSLLKIIAGLLNPSTGTTEIFSHHISSYSRRELAKKIAVVPQEIPLDFPFTVLETVLMGRAPHLGLLGFEQKHDNEKAWQAMEFTDVTHLADRRLHHLSGGERQRVIIARALCQDPEIILLDEPTAALDLAHQIHIMDLLERFRSKRQSTIIMVSHDLNLAAMYGEPVVLMQDGRIVRHGPPEDVLTRDLLIKTYGCDLMVDRNPLLKTPRILPVPEKCKQ